MKGLHNAFFATFFLSDSLECGDVWHMIPFFKLQHLSPEFKIRWLWEQDYPVYEAEQVSLGRKVALKVLPFAAMAQDKALQRFRNEVRAAAALDHPNIVSVYSVGEERGVHYYAMQLVRGKSLADVIAELSKLSRGNEAITGESISRIVSSVTSQERSFFPYDATIASGS